MEQDGCLGELRERGWVTFARALPRPKLVDILARLGGTRTVSRAIRASDIGEARPNTLSARYGMERFPLHTDCADMLDPPRYLMLFSPKPRRAATLVLNVRLLPDAFPGSRNALFRVVRRGNDHYARFVERRTDGQMVRYNAATHSPMDEAATRVSAAIASGVGTASRIDWTLTRAAIIDNWNCLHGRETMLNSNGGHMRRLHIWTTR